MSTPLTKNRHQNLFTLFRGGDHIENNLTRALAICLEQDPLFLRLFLQLIVDEKEPGDASAKLFDHLLDDDQQFKVSIQVNARDFPYSEVEVVYGVALTANSMSVDFSGEIDIDHEKEDITDILLKVQGCLFVIEAKRHEQNCNAQLQNQLKDCPKHKRKPSVSISWEDVLRQMRNAENTYQIMGRSSWILVEFMELISRHYSDWLPSQPFFYLPLPESGRPTSEMEKRLMAVRQAMDSQSDYEVAFLQQRTAIQLDWEWASEVQMYFERQGEGREPLLVLYLWPGNTKEQGWPLYYNSRPEWDKNTVLAVGDQVFEISIIPQIKFCNNYRAKYEKHVNIEDQSRILHPIHNRENMDYAGRWLKNTPGRTFTDLANYLDQHLDIDWRREVDWNERYAQNPNRTALIISFGYEVRIFVPYQKLRELDRTENDKEQVAQLLLGILEEFKRLVEL